MPPVPVPSKHNATRGIRRVALGCLLVAAASWFVPWGRERDLRLQAVAAPERELADPHPVEQLQAVAPSLAFAWLSEFVDLGAPARLRSVTVGSVVEAERVRVFVRSAAHTRSFRIRRLAPSDQPALSWRPLDSWPSDARRFVQLAVIWEGARAAPGGQPLELRIRYDRPARGWSLALAGLGALLLLLPRPLTPLADLGRQRWGVALLIPVLAVNLACLWGRNAVEGDEGWIIRPARDLYLSGGFVPNSFSYPHPLIYAHAGCIAAYSFYRAVAGEIGFHDPYSGQVYFEGEPLALRRIFAPGQYRHLFVEEAHRVARNAYVLAGGLVALAVYALARRVSGEAAGFFAGLAFAVQPLVLRQSANMLPNLPAALGGLLLALALLRPLGRDRDVLWTAALCGFVAGFKYNPVLAFVLIGSLWLDRRWRTGPRPFLVALAGLPLGFWLAYPTLPLQIQRFVSDAGEQAFTYGHYGHSSMLDVAWPALPVLLYFRAPHYGNYLVAALALLGLGGLALRRDPERARRLCVLVGLPLLTTLFLLRQFVQYGRNYCLALACVCVLAGCGADAVLRGLGAAARALGWRRTAAPVAAGLALAVVVASTGRELWLGRDVWANRVSAREQAIRWLNRNAELGSRVGILEPLPGTYQGVVVDSGRLKAERLQGLDEASLARFDYLLVGEAAWRAKLDGRMPALRFGPGGAFSLPPEYAVYSVRHGAAPPDR